MIDRIIDNTRIKFASGLNYRSYFYFEELISFALDTYKSEKKPIIKVVYTLSKECQIYSIENSYI